VRRFAPIAVAVLLVAGCGGEVDLAASGPGAAQVRMVENLYAGRFGAAWADLAPEHQRIVSREQFARCAERAVAVGDLDSVEVLDVFDDEIKIPGLRERRAKAVRVRLISRHGEQFTTVQHEIKVGNRWRWVLNSAAVRAYQRNRCLR
jgi:hypothetical protein